MVATLRGAHCANVCTGEPAVVEHTETTVVQLSLRFSSLSSLQHRNIHHAPSLPHVCAYSTMPLQFKEKGQIIYDPVNANGSLQLLLVGTGFTEDDSIFFTTSDKNCDNNRMGQPYALVSGNPHNPTTTQPHNHATPRKWGAPTHTHTHTHLSVWICVYWCNTRHRLVQQRSLHATC